MKFPEIPIKDRKVWLILGPVLLLFSAGLSLFAHEKMSAFYVTISALSLLCVLRWRRQALYLSLGVIALTFSIQLILGSPFSIWNLFWMLSLGIGLAIFDTSIGEYLNSDRDELNRLKKELLLSQEALSLQKEEALAMQQSLEQESESLREALHDREKQLESFKELVDAAQTEADAVFKQNDDLLAESLNNYRKIVALEDSCKKLEADLEQAMSYKIHAKSRLKELNALRVAHFQLQLLYQKACAKKLAPPFKKASKKMPQLLKMEEQKGALKKIYDQLKDDYEELNKRLEKTAKKPKPAPTDQKMLEQLKAAIAEKKQALMSRREELVHLDQELFAMKRSLQEEGVPAYST